MRRRNVHSSTNTQRGFTIVESVLAAAFLFVAALVVCQMFTLRAQIFLLNEEQRGAEAQIEQLMSRLAAQPLDTIVDGRDRVIVPTPGGAVAPTLPADCAGWPCYLDGWGTPLPAGASVLFARRWTVNSVDAPRNLIGVTVSVARDEQSAEPLVRRTTNVVPQ